MVLAATGYIAEALIEERGPTRGLGRDEQQLARELERKGIIARSKKTLKVFKDTLSIAHYNVAVLIYGETGSGKEVIARYIHENSGRKGKFIACNCSAIAGAWLKASYSVTKKGHLPAPPNKSPDFLNLPIRERFFSMRSVICQWNSNQNC